MEKIVQLREYEYNKLTKLAMLNEQQINEKAISLWEEKGVAEITIELDIKEDWYRERSIKCSSSLWYKDDKFKIPEDIRCRLSDIIKEYVSDIAEKEMGEPVKNMNNLNREYKALAYFKYIMCAIAASGWVAFITYLCVNKII